MNGVLKNAYGSAIKEDSTFATWLHDVGYVTGFFGKYINKYPFGRAPYVPPGWDDWLAKSHGSVFLPSECSVLPLPQARRKGRNPSMRLEWGHWKPESTPASE